jgi:hypothetical protein
VERVFVHKFENLVNGLGQRGIAIGLAARFAGDFRVGVSINEDFALGVTVARTDAEKHEAGGGGVTGHFKTSQSGSNQNRPL